MILKMDFLFNKIQRKNKNLGKLYWW